jgi:succinoglycan biosynthesis transport protein ExoP
VHRTTTHRSAVETALDVWARRKWVAIVAFGAVIAAAFSVTMALPDLYRATTTVLVAREQVSEAYVRASVTSELETRIQTIQQEVMSRGRLADLITRLDLYPEARKRGPFGAVERMRRDIQLELKAADQPSTGRTTTIAFALSYVHQNAEVAARVANALASVYVEENTKTRERQASRTVGFLKDQLAEAKKALDDQERHASEFKIQHLGELPQQVAANLAGLERLNTQLRLNGEQQLRSMERRERLDRQLNVADSSAPASGTDGSNPAAELSRLKLKLADMRRQYADEYPDVVRLRNQIAVLEAHAPAPEAETTTDHGAADSKRRARRDLDDVEAELAALKSEETALRRAIEGFEQRVENAPRRGEEFQTLSRDYDATKERYTQLLQKYEEAQLAANLEQGQQVEQFRVLDPALPPREPAAPNRSRLLALGFVFAVALAVGAMMGAERLDTAFHSVDELRAFTTVPTLVTLPLIVTKRDIWRRRGRAALATICLLIGLTLIVAGSRYFSRGNEQIVRLIDRGHV